MCVAQASVNISPLSLERIFQAYTFAYTRPTHSADSRGTSPGSRYRPNLGLISFGPDVLSAFGQILEPSWGAMFVPKSGPKTDEF